MPRREPVRGEVWWVDLGLRAKTRPCLVLSVPVEDQDRAIVTYIPRTTSRRGSRFEVEVGAKLFDQTGVFDAQGIDTIDHSKFLRCIGRLSDDELQSVAIAVKNWLGLDRPSNTVEEVRERVIDLNPPQAE